MGRFSEQDWPDSDERRQLIVSNAISYETFHEWQQVEIDFLIGEGIVENTSQQIKIASPSQFRVLRDLWDREAASYYHCTPKARAAIHDMLHRGWLERRRSLLTGAEASYVNYFLNQSEFSNGPDLRNRYLHGQQHQGEDVQAHRETYLRALRMLIGFVIKINDDFTLRAGEVKEKDAGAGGP